MNSFTELHNQWISFSTIVSLTGLLALYQSSRVPLALQRVFRYGKTASNDQPVKHALAIPKQWFFHFYVFASLFYATLLYALLRVYCLALPVPHVLQLTLDAVVGRHRRQSVPPESVLVATLLIQAQVARRLYECTQLSVFSRDGKMALIHYLCGFAFYFGVGLSLLADAHGFSSGGLPPPPLSLRRLLSLHHVTGVIAFVVCSRAQFRSHAILAQLRKDAKGRVVSYGHSIPRGHWFELVSCPHYFAEILVYLSLSLVLSGRSHHWWLVCLFVAANQTIVGLFNHRWYLQHFDDYPKQRKAIIPFLL